LKARLQKVLAEAGVASRRQCEDLIRVGRVTVDGHVATLGTKVDIATEEILVDGQPLPIEETEYWLFNKPAGILSAAHDSRGRTTVVEFVPSKARLYPVGRLDLASTGLLILTNDGELTARLLHPSYHVEKEYVVLVHGRISPQSLEQLRRGVVLEDGPTAEARVDLLDQGRLSTGGTTSTVRMTIHEGRKRQVRRMLEAVGHRVIALHRSRFDGLTDSGLALGQVRRLSDGEIDSLRKAAFGG